MSSFANKNNTNAMSQNNNHAKPKLNVITNTNEINQNASLSNTAPTNDWTTLKKEITPTPLTQILNHQYLCKNAYIKIKKIIYHEEPLRSTQPNGTTTYNTQGRSSPPPDIEPEVIVKPPHPIFVKDVHDFPGLCTELIALIGVDNFNCKSTTDLLKIQTANPESYRKLLHFRYFSHVHASLKYMLRDSSRNFHRILRLYD